MPKRTSEELEATLSYERLREILSYNLKSGKFTWIKKTSIRTKIGEEAGHTYTSANGRQYLHLTIDYNKFACHRLAWFYVTGAWPDFEIDHCDGDGLNNRWLNLRPAEHQQNSYNTKLRVDNKTGVKGVSYDCSRGKYAVDLNGRHFGRYATLHEAKAVRERLARVAHGDFYREE